MPAQAYRSPALQWGVPELTERTFFGKVSRPGETAGAILPGTGFLAPGRMETKGGSGPFAFLRFECQSVYVQSGVFHPPG